MAFDSQSTQAETGAIPGLLGPASDVNLRELQREIGQIILRCGDGLPAQPRRLCSGADRFRCLLRVTMPTSVATAFRRISTRECSITDLVLELDLLAVVTENGKLLLRKIVDELFEKVMAQHRPE